MWNHHWCRCQKPTSDLTYPYWHGSTPSSETQSVSLLLQGKRIETDRGFPTMGSTHACLNNEYIIFIPPIRNLIFFNFRQNENEDHVMKCYFIYVYLFMFFLSFFFTIVEIPSQTCKGTNKIGHKFLMKMKVV